MKLRHRLRQSPIVLGLVARAFSGWMRLCNATSRGEILGQDELRESLSQGPVLIVLWHEYLMMAPVHWAKFNAPMMSLHENSPVGTLVAAVQKRFGLTPIAMSSKTSNFTVSRMVKQHVSQGTSVGITADGPEGPARILKSAPLDWARATGVPVFVYANASTRQRRLKTWDKMVMPLPFGRSVGAYVRWEVEVPRRSTDEMREGLRLQLEAALIEVAEKAEGMVAER